jgi:hypothetical protein
MENPGRQILWGESFKREPNDRNYTVFTKVEKNM